MDVSKLKRNAGKVHKALKRQKNGSVLATTSLDIHIPKRFFEANLATLATEVSYVAIYALVVGDSYGVSNTCAKVVSIPSDTSTVTVDGVEYTVLKFVAGDVVFKTSSVVKIDTLVYYIWNELVDKGKTPWYMDMEDVASLVVTAGSYANAHLSKNHSIIEMIHSVRFRTNSDRTQHYRYHLNAKGTKEPVVIGLRNVQLTVETTSARIGGSYAETGLSSALLNPSDKAEGLEKLLLE